MANNSVDLNQSLAQWDTPAFSNTLKQQLIALSGDTLPLQQGLRHSNYASDDVTDAVIMKFESDGKIVRGKAGIFYRGMISGACCADDPTPVDYQPEYCVVLVTIDCSNGHAHFSLVE